MTVFNTVTFATFFLENDDFVAALVLENRGGNGSARERRLADFVAFAFAGREDVVDFDGRALFGAGIAVNGQNVSLGHSELLALGLDGRFHK